MVGSDFDPRGAFEVVPLLLEAVDDGEELLIVYRVVDLSPREFPRAVGNRIPSVLPFEGKYARAGITRRIYLYARR